MGVNKISMFKGDSKTLIVSIVNQDNSVFDLTGYSVVFSIKNEKSDSAYILQKKNTLAGGDSTQIEMTDLSNGKFKVYIKSVDTINQRGKGNNYVYDIQITQGDIVKTPVDDQLIMKEDITR